MYEHLRYARETLLTKRAALPSTPDQGVPAPAAAAEEAKKALRALPADTAALRKSYSRKPTLSSFKCALGSMCTAEACAPVILTA